MFFLIDSETDARHIGTWEQVVKHLATYPLTAEGKKTMRTFIETGSRPTQVTSVGYGYLKHVRIYPAQSL